MSRDQRSLVLPLILPRRYRVAGPSFSRKGRRFQAGDVQANQQTSSLQFQQDGSGKH
jgi:hypothetical protein